MDGNEAEYLVREAESLVRIELHEVWSWLEVLKLLVRTASNDDVIGVIELEQRRLRHEMEIVGTGIAGICCACAQGAPRPEAAIGPVVDKSRCRRCGGALLFCCE